MGRQNCLRAEGATLCEAGWLRCGVVSPRGVSVIDSADSQYIMLIRPTAAEIRGAASTKTCLYNYFISVVLTLLLGLDY